MGIHLTRRLAYFYALLFATPRLAGLHYFLLKLALRGLGVMNYYDHLVSGEDFFVSSVLPRIVRHKSPVFLDVGANRGEYSIMLARKFPDARIFAFEPHPGSYKILKDAKIQNLLPYELALSDTTKYVKLYDFTSGEGSSHASLYPGVIVEVHRQQPEVNFTVRTDTLDSFAVANNIEYIDLLKIDTEGNELSILRGGKQLLQENRIHAIQFEFNEMNVYSDSFFHSFSTLLENFALFRLLPRGLLPLPQSPLFTELFGFQNILAIPEQETYLL